MPTKSDRLEVRLTPEIKRLIERAAAVSGQPISAFAVSNLAERAREVLARHAQTTLSTRDWRIFLQVLDEEAPTPALRKAARRRRARK